MPTDTSHPDAPGCEPDPTADYEAAGVKVLASHTRLEMRKSVTRLKRELRSAFAAESDLARTTKQPSG